MKQERRPKRSGDSELSCRELGVRFARVRERHLDSANGVAAQRPPWHVVIRCRPILIA